MINDNIFTACTYSLKGEKKKLKRMKNFNDLFLLLYQDQELKLFLFKEYNALHG